MSEQRYTPADVEEQIATLSPILQLEEGEQILAVILKIRATKSDYGEGELIDCRTVGGTDFTLRGHAILCSKLKPLDPERFPLHIIRYNGKVGRAHDYYVAKMKGDWETAANDVAGQTEVARVEAAIKGKISELPPRT